MCNQLRVEPNTVFHLFLGQSLDASAAELVRVAKEFGFEGIVAKRKDSAYESGKRSGAWVKYKVNQPDGSSLNALKNLTQGLPPALQRLLQEAPAPAYQHVEHIKE